jgi:hypothetical protein
MSFQTTIAHTVNPASGNPVTDSNAYSAGQVTDLEETIVAGDTVFSNFDVDVSEAEVVIIECDRDIIVKINDDGSPDATINLLAGKPCIWKADGYFLNPLGTVDVTSFKVTLAAGDDATFRIHVLQDPSP